MNNYARHREISSGKKNLDGKNSMEQIPNSPEAYCKENPTTSNEYVQLISATISILP